MCRLHQRLVKAHPELLLHDVEQVVGHTPDGEPIKRLTIDTGGTPRFLTPAPGVELPPGRGPAAV